jgi:hypothetical protein
LAANYDDLHRRGLQVISIHGDVPRVRNAEDLAAFLKGEQWADVTFPGFVCMDAPGPTPDTHVLFESLNLEAWPTLLLVGPDGTLLHVVKDGSVRELFHFSPILPTTKPSE